MGDYLLASAVVISVGARNKKDEKAEAKQRAILQGAGQLIPFCRSPDDLDTPP